ncbi:MAG: AAA family ATPase [Pseudomonadales bacterium]|nr:AAA family ATPase [Pseudomonadales bacterium]MCP5331754.1 AAA family ATPase [Pseudomonadales bacterium]
MSDSLSLPVALSAEQLFRRCDPAGLGFATTAELRPSGAPLGQQRAIEAMAFALDVKRPGYNIFALGTPGSGRHAMIEQMLKRRAATEAVPGDTCHVHNFAQPNKPIWLKLPCGMGVQLRDAMTQLVEDLHSAIRTAFESDEYRARRQVIEQEAMERREAVIEQLREEAKAEDALLITLPTGFAFVPVRNGEMIKPDEFHQLPQELRDRYEERITALQKRLQDALAQFPVWEREMRNRIKALNQAVTLSAVGLLIGELKQRFATLPAVLRHLDAVQDDVVDNAQEFLGGGEEETANNPFAPQPTFTRYQVNLLVSHDNGGGAPVVYCDLPSQPNLIGRVEYRAQYGMLSTDLTLIRPGALHQANGGYLMLDAAKVLTQPLAWEGLKRSLRAGEIRIESLDRALGLSSTVTLEPEPIPLDLKVVLVGEPLLFTLLSQYDPEFLELFKVMADFDDDLERSPDSERAIAAQIARIAGDEAMLPFEAAAVARIIEQGSRAIEDSQRISIRQDLLHGLMVEADHCARQQGSSAVSAAAVERAITAQINRADRLRGRLQEQILRDTVRIDCSGQRVGQINGLAVLSFGNFLFGHPSRITARVRPGSGGVLDIERKVELGGSLHSKGVLILSSYLAAQYGLDGPLSLSASLVFEQSYGGVDGDSASSTELYALLSALAELPIRQSWAVTGSVDQFGRVQAIGGVNEKIEGFFDICRARGLTSEQGVLIPASNVQHLMLRQEVVDACRNGQFKIFAVETIDQGIALLTGVAAGQRDAEGRYPADSVNGRVEARLNRFAQQLQRKPQADAEADEADDGAGP